MRTTPIQQRRLLLASILYALAIHLPFLHDLVYAEEDCETCEQICAEGSRVEPVCDASGPCENPEHHHHHRHQHAHGQCLSCQHSSAPALPLPVLGFGLFNDTSGVDRPRSASRPEPRALIGLYLARAPPRHS